MDGNIIGSALAKEQVSHYDPKANRCYVELDVHMADLSKYDEYYSRYCYDGQTGELLGWVRSEKGIKTGFFKNADLLNFDAVEARIDNLMADD